MLKKSLFYICMTALIFAGQFLRSGDLVTGKPPLAAKAVTLAGAAARPLIEKGPAILYFWGEWCGVCNTMRGSISAVSADYPVLTVALRSGSDTALPGYLREKQLFWQVVNDPKGEVAHDFGVKAVPSLFFINPAGDIVFTSVGWTSEWGMRARLWLAGLL